MAGSFDGAAEADLRAQSQPSDGEVRAELERLIASPALDVPARVRRFLRYIVEETLAGRAERIKAYTVGIEVFDRDPGFDAQSDPVVRIEAGRLRRALERYYLVADRTAMVIISIPKGGYVPLFERGSGPSAAHSVSGPPAEEPKVEPSTLPHWWRRIRWLGASAGAAALAIPILGLALWAPWSPKAKPVVPPFAGPSLVVIPFLNLGENPEARIYADGLTEELLNQLARFKELAVLGRETSRSIPPGADVARIRRELGVRYVLEGSVRAVTHHLRVTGRLLDAETGAVLWSQSYDDDLGGGRDLLSIQDDVAQKVATAVAQPYGIIYRADERRSGASLPDDLDAYVCTLQFYGYRAALSAESHLAIRTCLERVVAAHPSYATAWAMLSILYLDEDRFEFNRKSGTLTAIQRAIDTARRAIRLDPANVRALQALMVALFFGQQPAEALEVGERAVMLNPNDTELLAELGSRVGQTGAWARGTALLEQALMRNPAHSDFYNGTLAVHAYMQRDYRRAEDLIRRVSMEKFPLYHFVAALIYAQLDLKPEAAEARERFLRMRPRFFEHWDQEAAKRNYRPEDAVHLAQGARKAGFPVPERTAAESALQTGVSGRQAP